MPQACRYQAEGHAVQPRGAITREQENPPVAACRDGLADGAVGAAGLDVAARPEPETVQISQGASQAMAGAVRRVAAG